EALAAGVPPLISDQTPWQDLDEAGVGWVRPLNDPSAFKDVIEQLAQTSQIERTGQRQRARQYARNLSENSVVMRQNLDLFFNACRQEGARS
ncbi:glycosyl transferase family 1, partial [Candidatus Micrarchaeota archaeon]|nr:glycosyl transferase family 1 [Candidatus Micrarchaeota archaeon]